MIGEVADELPGEDQECHRFHVKGGACRRTVEQLLMGITVRDEVMPADLCRAQLAVARREQRMGTRADELLQFLEERLVLQPGTVVEEGADTEMAAPVEHGELQ